MDFYKFLLVFGITYIFNVDVYCILMQKNTYHGISIGFSDQVQQHHFDFDKLKKVLIKSSELLFHATRKRAYFGSFTLVLPTSWSKDFCTKLETESPEMINIYVTNFLENSTVRTQHSKGCSKEGDIIYLPLNLLNGEIEDLARQILQQWSIYRFGVFEESPLEEAACYASTKGDWSPVGCYNVKIPSKPEFSEAGLPYCSVTEDTLLPTIKSSLMTNFSKALDFCDGSPEFPHNPVMPTLHNNLCEGKTVWSIIENSEDFKHGKNLPVKFSKPPVPSFKCFQESTMQLTFVIQTCSTNDITLVVQELRYTLFHFLKNFVPANMKINLVTFSNDTRDSIELSLENEEKLREDLDNYVATNEIVTTTCLLCGIQKAMNVYQAKYSSTVVIIAWESALIGTKTSYLIESMKEKVRLHFLLIKDTSKDAIPTDLVKAVRSTGGFIHSLPKPIRFTSVPNVLLNSKLNVILSSVATPPLQVEDKIVIVHEGKYENDAEILDTFSIPSGTTGKLIYMMHCDLKGQINSWDRNCFRWDEKSTTFLCGNVQNLNDDMNRTWQYKFGIQKGVDIPICASTAILFKSSSTRDTFFLRGWLNEYVINPGENALIIYAEITNRSPDTIYEVLADISGPGMETPYVIKLWDNGNGDPDVKNNDGIYSRYFTFFKEKGTYTVTISARDSNTKPASIYQNVELASEDSGIQQKKIIGSFSVPRNPSEIDIIPPNRVADLKVLAIDHENSNVTLQWTAPGGDYDSGQAMKYEIKYSTNPGSLQKLYFDSEDTSKLEEMSSPKIYGQLEVQTFIFPKTNSSTTYNIALRATDDNKNKGKISNIVHFYISQPKNVIVDPDKSSTENIDVTSISPKSSPTIPGTSEDANFSSTESSSIDPSSIDDLNTTNVVTEQPKQTSIFDTKYKILTYSVGAIILLIIIVNIFLWCYCLKKRRKKLEESKKLSRKSSLRPPYNINIAYQQESESINQSEADISITNLTDRNSYSSSPMKQDNSPNYTFHTSKSLLNRSKSKTDPELGFKVVQTMPAYATTSLSRFARRLNSNDTEQITPSVAQPQQPSSSNENYMYALGEV